MEQSHVDFKGQGRTPSLLKLKISEAIIKKNQFRGYNSNNLVDTFYTKSAPNVLFKKVP